MRVAGKGSTGSKPNAPIDKIISPNITEDWIKLKRDIVKFLSEHTLLLTSIGGGILLYFILKLLFSIYFDMNEKINQMSSQLGENKAKYEEMKYRTWQLECKQQIMSSCERCTAQQLAEKINDCYKP